MIPKLAEPTLPALEVRTVPVEISTMSEVLVRYPNSRIFSSWPIAAQ